MNEKNVGSREACERLVKAGIVLETDYKWSVNLHSVGYRLSLSTSDLHTTDLFPTPAPSMAEVWRELPESYGACTTLILEKHYDNCIAGYYDWDEEDFTEGKFRNTNPTDALIDLLIWVRKEGT